MRKNVLIVITLFVAIIVMTGTAVANPNPKNLEKLATGEHSSAIISNGLIQLGVNDQGHLVM